MMKTKLMAAAGILAMLAGLAVNVIPPGHIPLLDANRQELAETESQGYCAGEIFMDTRGRGHEPERVQECVEQKSAGHEYDHSKVQHSFCGGIIGKGYPITINDCLGILQQHRMWPTLGGHLTAEWNRRFPYPGDVVGAAKAENKYGRTGDREDNNRLGAP